MPPKYYRILVASPADVARERATVQKVITKLNENFKLLRIPCRLEIYSWNDDTFPDLGSPEKVLLSQIPVETSDIFIAIFWKRFGTRTGDYQLDGMPFLSGTQEEIDTAITSRQKNGKPVIMIFRILRSISPNLTTEELEQLTQLQSYLSRFRPLGNQPALFKEVKPGEFERLLMNSLMAMISYSWTGSQAFAPGEDKTIGQGIKSEGRDALINKIKQLATEYPSTSPQIIDLWGGRGIGKTTLLKKLSEELRSTEEWQILGPWDMANTLDRMNFFEFQFNHPRPDASYNIFLIDNIDAAFADRDKLQLEKVINSLLNNGSTLIVTSRHKIYQWPSDDLNYRQKDFGIPLLTPSEVYELSKEGENAYAFSFGHPQMLQWFSNQHLNEHQLSINAKIYFMENLSLDDQAVLYCASLLPLFSEHLLLKIILEISGRSYTLDQLMHTLNNLKREGVIYWDKDYGMYRFTNIAIRRLISKAHSFEDSIGCQHIHALAADYFVNEARRSDYLSNVMVSAVYHTAFANREDVSQIGKNILDWFNEGLRTWVNVDWSRVVEAWSTGTGEIDIIQEIRELVTDEIYFKVDRLLAFAKNAVEVENESTLSLG